MERKCLYGKCSETNRCSDLRRRRAGMNAAIRSVVRACTYMGIECVGIRRGYNGLINGDFMVLKNGNVAHIINRGRHDALYGAQR